VKVGDKVKMAPMWKYEEAVGVIEKIMESYVVVKWEGIPGHWHYTEEQSKRLEIVNEDR